MTGSELTGRRALVTGAASHGIGRAIATALAGAGCDVAVHHLNQATAAEELAQAIRETGRSACVLEADLADPGAGRALVAAAIERLGGLEIAVNCAATLARVPFLEITDDEWDRVHAVNLRGYFAVAQEAARHMVRAGQGCAPGRVDGSS